MRNLIKSSFILLAVASMTFLASCGEDDPEDQPLPTEPSLSLSGELSSEDSFEVGDSVAVTVTFATPGELSGFNYQVTINKDSADESAQSKVFQGPTDIGFTDTDVNGSFNYIFSESLDENLGGKTVTIDFEVVDKANQSEMVSWTFEVIIADPEVVSYTEKLLYAQLDSDASKTFFSTNLGMTVSKGEVDAAAAPNSSDIDFGYAVGASGTAWLASPSNYPAFTGYVLTGDGGWNTLNTTSFKKVTLSNEEYIAIKSNADLEALYTGSTATAADRVEGVAADDYYALQLDVTNKGGLYALVKVLAKVDGNSDGDFIDSTDRKSVV